MPYRAIYGWVFVMNSKPQLSSAPPRGMRDFYPEDMILRNRVFDAWKTAARQFGFQEYDACVVESLDVLIRKGGEEIVRQIYAFQDKSGRDLALRPEMTPTLARMIAARQNALSFPVKWFAIAQCFRYERMTRGRKREHYQWNLDIIGEPDVSAEAEVIGAAVHALGLLGLTPQDYQVRFSSRALLADLLEALHIPAERHAAVFLALDKLGKLDEPAIRDMLADAGLDAHVRDRLFEIMTLKTLPDTLAILDRKTPAYTAAERLLDLLANGPAAEAVAFDISVVRGLSYYTGIVFEAFDRAGQFRAIFGGGRYDNLLADTGGRPASGVGLGFGDVVVSEILADKRPSAADPSGPDLHIGFMDEAQCACAMRIAAAHRADGATVDLALHPEKAKAFFSRAQKNAALEALYIGPDDLAADTARVKNMRTREERILPL